MTGGMQKDSQIQESHADRQTLHKQPTCQAGTLHLQKSSHPVSETPSFSSS